MKRFAKCMACVVPAVLLLGGCTKKLGLGSPAVPEEKYVLQKNDMREYINVETNFVFAQRGSDAVVTNVYSAKSGTDASRYFLPIFEVEKDVYLTIEMTPSMLSKAEKASKRQTSSDLEIPVAIEISKSRNIEITQTGGIQGVVHESLLDGTERYSFVIKNNGELHPTVRLQFTPAEIGDAKIAMTYGLPEYKIVDSSCDVFQIVKFVEKEE